MDYEISDMANVFRELESSSAGLAEEEAKSRLERYGFNELEGKSRVTAFKIFVRQFANFIVWVLFAAAMISLIVGEELNFWVISSIIGFVILLGFVQEYKAEKAMEALKNIVEPITAVLRDGKVREIMTRMVVPGDILLLESGNKIPADAKIFNVVGLKVDEAALTGESVSVEKKKGDLIFAGTQIVHGKCKALVIATGMQTKLGKIAGMIQEAEEQTPLQVKMGQLAKSLAIIALVACVLTFTLGLLTGAPLKGMLLIALALAVAAVPEGLPLTLTLTLAYGMHRMAGHNALVRKMLGVETLGSTTVICTDKTGTLTKNEMTVEKIFIDGGFIDITGVGYEPDGDFYTDGEKIDAADNNNLALLLKAAALCNNAILEKRGGKWEVIGDPTEVSLIVTAAKADLWADDLEDEYRKIEEIVFTSERKLMTTVHKKDGEIIAFTKGAPEVVLKKCKFITRKDGIEKLDANEITGMLEANSNLAASAFRVLGVAYRNVAEPLTPENIEKDLVFLGLTAIIDPPREEAKNAISTCKKAGIKVVMITGDNGETAKAVARKIGLFDEDQKLDDIADEKLRRITRDGAITGSDLDELDENELSRIVEVINIYARTMPEQKLRIVKALQDKGHIVGMTGDGVNDAPALKKADIGIAMGIKGTDVARESSVMILQDDNFATIVEAVRRGRTIYENIEKFTCYLISRNFTEVILILLGITLLGFEFLPLLALQILFINMFDEIMPAIGLGLDPIREGIMSKNPRNPEERILKKRNMVLIVSIGAIMALASFLVFILDNPDENIERARTLTFAAIVSMILFIPFAFRSLEEPIYKIGILANRLLIVGAFTTFLLTLGVMYIPFFQKIFEFTTLSPADWITPLSAAVGALIFVELIKMMTRKIA